MVSVDVSKLGCTHFIFVDPGMKINGCYYREVLLSQQHPSFDTPTETIDDWTVYNDLRTLTFYKVV